MHACLSLFSPDGPHAPPEMLIFLEATYRLTITASHIPGRKNTLADDLSRNKITSLFLTGPLHAQDPHATPSDGPRPSPESQTGLDVTVLDGAVKGYCRLKIAPSTRKTYESAVRRFGSFCSKYSIMNPFPVDKSILCYFVAFLAIDGLAPQSIKSYLVAIRHTQIEAGLPEPKSLSSCPRRKVILNEVARQRMGRSPPKKPRLPILAHTLLGMYRTMAGKVHRDTIMLWAACSISFGGFL